ARPRSALFFVWLLAAPGLARAQGEGAHTDPALAQRAAERLKTLHEEADRLSSQERTVLGELRKLELARQIANEELKQADAGAAGETAGQIETLDGQVHKLEAARDSERPLLEQRLVEMYKLGRGRYARLLLSTTDVLKIGQASRTVAALAARDHDRLESYGKRL